MPDIELPYRFEPRGYQIAPFAAFDEGIKRLMLVWHRRTGKDKTCVNICAREAMRRIGTYYYFFPTYAQGKKVIWDGKDKDGFPFLGHFPREFVLAKNSTEMKLTLKHPTGDGAGSIFQIVGADNIDSVMGTNAVGVVFSEFSLQNPKGWDFIRPILVENNGWALFNGTPRGKNHFFKMAQMAEANPKWFYSLLGADDTGIVSEAQIQDERDQGMAEELIQQEFYCSWSGYMQGSYYSTLLQAAYEEKRVGRVPYDKSKPVDTWWDIGHDGTSIWFVQEMPGHTNVIDYVGLQGKSLPDYWKLLQEKPYIYGKHIGPHDIEHKDYGSGRTRKEAASELGMRFTVAPKLSVEDGINAVRMLLPMCYFDESKCDEGLEALGAYRKEWDEKLQQFKNTPLHDWASHPADAFRVGATGRRGAKPKSTRRHSYGSGKPQRTSKGWMAA